MSQTAAAIAFAPELQAQEYEHKCSSGRTFKFRELNALEQLQADSAAGDTQTSIYNRLAVALVSVDAQPFIPIEAKAKVAGITVRLTRLRGSEADELMLAYLTAFQPKGEDLKNESTPDA